MTIGRAVRGDRAFLVTGEDAGGRQLGDGIGGILDRSTGLFCRGSRLVSEIGDALLRFAEVRAH